MSALECVKTFLELNRKCLIITLYHIFRCSNTKNWSLGNLLQFEQRKMTSFKNCVKMKIPRKNIIELKK